MAKIRTVMVASDFSSVSDAAFARAVALAKANRAKLLVMHAVMLSTPPLGSPYIPPPTWDRIEAALHAVRQRLRPILMTSVAGKEKIFLCGGDMSCPGAALIQTANLQARVPTITSVEANARQYLPQANKAWESRFPGMFRVTDGMLRTQEINGPGLGAAEV